jgi:hypothetical protein
MSWFAPPPYDTQIVQPKLVPKGVIPSFIGDPGLALNLLMHEGYGNVVKDYSPYKNHGRIYNATWVQSGSATAFSFNGVNAYVTFGNILSMAGTQPFTVVIRAYLTPYTGSWRFLLDKDFINLPKSSWSISLLPTSNTLRFERWDGTNDTYIYKSFTPNNWYIIIARYDGSTMYLRFDTESDLTTPSTISLSATDGPLTLGCHSSLQYYTDTIVSRLIIWTRFLSDAEAKRQYESLNLIVV